ncbi:exodeoxyribonuclease 7 small subunit [Methylopila jiangsuensis]|uniref:Exodeoxyribonuclease 7 small subunit n=1 Tax=Methylopila jiangsuensis TaxID=586230 RepID=A0A9W6JFH5_9HYPH|nr:exodeoxyribonuclease VII small subunit [Methylopila jiangsuensis]MDR6285728.1 exodeoxyribonuclease VII small subunit [Methylopila jiangsuensis]GLK75486.1 exodeoxyribonuclease 7 small subunit [Methylopila jiangsuensis]
MTDVRPADVADLSFEAALAELERIVGRLEQGQVPLEESIEIYRRGEALKARCDDLLKKAEARVETISVGADGSPKGLAALDPE